MTTTTHVISGPTSINPNIQTAKKNAAADDMEKKPNRMAIKQILKKRQGTCPDVT
jgi:survival-of-motor-neuron-related-splicing factor 30